MKREPLCQSLGDYFVLLTLCLAVMAFAERQREVHGRSPVASAGVFASVSVP